MPVAIVLYAGLHGWEEGLAAEGWRSIGFDIVDMCALLGHQRPANTSLVIQDVRTLHGSQFRNADLIVASPPCQAYSYRAMPWKRAKALPPPSNELFDVCFLIQREASAAAGRYIPMIVENVRGAVKWVEHPVRWHFGSYYLWGDVPALMPTPRALKVPGQDWNRFNETGKVSPHWRMQSADVKTVGHINKRNGHAHTRHLTNQRESDAIKQHGSGPIWFDTGIARLPSASPNRRAASAAIAKIPFPLAQHIARVFKSAVIENEVSA